MNFKIFANDKAPKSVITVIESPKTDIQNKFSDNNADIYNRELGNDIGAGTWSIINQFCNF